MKASFGSMEWFGRNGYTLSPEPVGPGLVKQSGCTRSDLPLSHYALGWFVGDPESHGSCIREAMGILDRVIPSLGRVRA